ncbi:MAG: glycogen synthase GlgA [bacterium]|nr:glycogen synthase GlgA [bacterium]MDY4098478.1 glycogen synthase GlgA [Lachnospiraceae bacterium]
MKKVLFVTSEAVPFIKTGGLADVAGSLARYIDKQEYDVRVILPKYACMDEMWKKKLRFHSHFYVALGWRNQYVGILETIEGGIHYYFIDNEYYFAGPKPYNQLHEDIEKFAYFSKAALAAIGMIDFVPDVIHCHDWQTALVPVFLKAFAADYPLLRNTKTIMTIHNLRFQGRYVMDAIKNLTGLSDDYFTPDKLESYGEANFLKGGIAYADLVTTVSPTYALEIMTREGGESLDGLLYARRNSLYGIINGLDTAEYDPGHDTYLTHNFTAADMKQGKAQNKLALQRELHLPEDKDTIMIAMVSRLTDQKGLDLLAYVMDEMLSHARLQLVVLGTGQEQYENMLRYFANKYPDKLSANIFYSEQLAHRIYASADALIMPSLFEPCGLSQLMSYCYGTLPIVRETGGLKDTVLPYNEYDHTGTGFSFANYNAHEMLQTIYYAMHIYYDDRAQWDEMAKRDMSLDYSWKKSAREYEKLYDRLLEGQTV